MYLGGLLKIFSYREREREKEREKMISFPSNIELYRLGMDVWNMANEWIWEQEKWPINEYSSACDSHSCTQMLAKFTVWSWWCIALVAFLTEKNKLFLLLVSPLRQFSQIRLLWWWSCSYRVSFTWLYMKGIK